jgi:hypothetical protein
VLRFQITDPVLALHYYALIHHDDEDVDVESGRSRHHPHRLSLRDRFVRDLVLETRHFDLLLGDAVRVSVANKQTTLFKYLFFARKQFHFLSIYMNDFNTNPFLFRKEKLCGYSVEIAGWLFACLWEMH